MKWEARWSGGEGRAGGWQVRSERQCWAREGQGEFYLSKCIGLELRV